MLKKSQLVFCVFLVILLIASAFLFVSKKKHSISAGEAAAIGPACCLSTLQNHNYENFGSITTMLCAVASAQDIYRYEFGGQSCICDLIALSDYFASKIDGPLDPAMHTGIKDNYKLVLSCSVMDGHGKRPGWYASAVPVDYQKGLLSFFIDDTCILRGDDLGGLAATQNSPELGGFSKQSFWQKLRVNLWHWVFQQ